MTDFSTTAAEFAAAIRHTTQKKVLENLRAELYFADPSMAEQGEFDNGSDTLLFTNVPDIAANTTTLTEGVRPDKRKLTMGTVTVSTAQYGDLVSITDVAKVKSPIEVSQIAAERLSRQAKESVDQIARDVIAAGGTTRFVGTEAARATILSTDVATFADLRKLAWIMFKAKIPRNADGFYHLDVSPEVAADLMADSSFTDAVKYTDRMPLLRNEIGEMAGFRIRAIVNAPTFASGVTVHRSIATGAVKGWGSGELQSLTTHYVPAGGDHTDPLAQEELAGWKVNFGVAVLANGRYYGYESGATSLA